MSVSTSDKFAADFVPVSRALVEELGYQVAYVFGIVWNYCQMENKICNASHDTIANRAGMSRRSVITHIDKLIEAGYIEDLTPDVRNAPHHLCTKKGMQNLHTEEHTIKEEVVEGEPEIDKETVYQEPVESAEVAHQNGTGMQELPSGCEKIAQLGMQNLHLNKQIQETDLKELIQEDEESRTRMREEKIAAIMRLYQDNITIGVNPITAQEMLSDEFLNLPLIWWEEAVKIASDNNIRKWSYVRGVLSRSIQVGLSPVTVGPPQNKPETNRSRGIYKNGHKTTQGNNRTGPPSPPVSATGLGEWTEDEKRLYGFT